jgi:hypothetical protein
VLPGWQRTEKLFSVVKKSNSQDAKLGEKRISCIFVSEATEKFVYTDPGLERTMNSPVCDTGLKGLIPYESLL